MRDCGLQKWVFLFFALEPRKKPSHFSIDAIRRRCFVMNPVAADWPRNNLHCSLAVIAPCTDPKFVATLADARKKMGVPLKQSFPCERLAKFLCCVQHHFDHAIHVTILVRPEPTDLQPKPSGQGRTDALWIERHAFDRARFDRF